MSALTVGVSLLPALGPGQLLTTYLDKLDRRKVLVSLDVLRALVFLVLALSPPIPVVLVLAAFAGLLTSPFDAIQSSMSTEVPSRARRDGAQTLIQVTQDVSALLGYAVGGALLAFLDPTLALVVNSASFLVSAALLARLPLPQEDISEASPWKGLRDGAAVIFSHRGFLLMAVLSVSSLTAGTVLESLVVAYFQEEGSPNLAGVAMPLIGVVTIVVVLLASPQTRRPTIRTTAVLLVLSSAATTALLLTGEPWLAVLAFALSGVLFVPVAFSSVLVKPLYPRQHRATTVSVLTGIRSGLAAGLIVLVGALADTVGTGTALAVLVALSGLVALPVVALAWKDPFVTSPVPEPSAANTPEPVGP
jgi:predicted MFS family arabinose efflux permease